MFFNPFMLKRTPAIQFGIAYINHVNRDPSQVTEVSLDGEYIPKLLLYTKCSLKKRDYLLFFFQTGTHTHRGTGFCTQPTQIFAIHQVIHKTMYCLMCVHIHYSRSQLPACKVSRGKHKDHRPADHTRCSKCSTLHAVSDHAGW